MRVGRALQGVAVVLVGSLALFGSLVTGFAAANDISVGDVFVCTITHGQGGLTADQRAVQVRQRLTNVLSVEGFRSNPNL